MSTAIQRRRGTTAQHATFIGLAGEITVDTDKKTAVVHDGVTEGGTPLATEAAVKAAQTAADAAARVFFGNSSTAADVAAKAVDCSGFGLSSGAVVSVTFANANTVADALSLNVNGSGAKPIYNQFGAVSATNPAMFPAGQPIEFVYDGTRGCWLYINRAAEAAHYSSPSDNVIYVSLPASGGEITAIADGKFNLRGLATAPNQTASFVRGTYFGDSSGVCTLAGQYCVASIMVKKGDKVKVFYDTMIANSGFIPAEGAK